MNKNRKERKINLIKTLKSDNAYLKAVKESLEFRIKYPFKIIYKTDLKHLRARHCVDNRFISIVGEKEADRFAKNAICNKISGFLKDDNIKKVVNRETDTTEYIFDFWV